MHSLDGHVRHILQQGRQITLQSKEGHAFSERARLGKAIMIRPLRWAMCYIIISHMHVPTSSTCKSGTRWDSSGTCGAQTTSDSTCLALCQ